MSPAPTVTWTDVCPLRALTPERGVAALVEGAQVAVFLLHSGEVLAVGNLDPFSSSMVLSRGLVGSVAGTVTVASPIYKQRFDLRTGRCLDDPAVCIPSYPARVEGGMVRIGHP